MSDDKFEIDARTFREQCIDRAMPYSKSGLKRLEATWEACTNVNLRNIEGDFVECGVWRGGNVMVARWASPLRRCWLFDTFTGMTEPGEHDAKRDGKSLKKKGWIGKSAVSAADVLDNLRQVDIGIANLDIVVGDVRKTLLDKSNLPHKIAVLRLDTDFYDSTKIEMEVLYPRLVSGGYLIVDDYGHWLGARKAVSEYLGESNLLKPIDYTGAWMVKP